MVASFRLFFFARSRRLVMIFGSAQEKIAAAAIGSRWSLVCTNPLVRVDTTALRRDHSKLRRW